MNFKEIEVTIDEWLEDYEPIKYGDSPFDEEVEQYSFYIEKIDNYPNVLIVHTVNL